MIILYLSVLPEKILRTCIKIVLLFFFFKLL